MSDFETPALNQVTPDTMVRASETPQLSQVDASGATLSGAPDMFGAATDNTLSLVSSPFSNVLTPQVFQQLMHARSCHIAARLWSELAVIAGFTTRSVVSVQKVTN